MRRTRYVHSHHPCKLLRNDGAGILLSGFDWKETTPVKLSRGVPLVLWRAWTLLARSSIDVMPPNGSPGSNANIMPFCLRGLLYLNRWVVVVFLPVFISFVYDPTRGQEVEY
jgi:hypothetical protein